MNLPNFLADIALRSSLVLAVALLLLLALRRASAADRHFALLLCLIVVAAVPACRLWGPHIPWTIRLPAAESRVLNLPEEIINASDISPASAEKSQSFADPSAPIPRPRASITFARLLKILLAIGACAQALVLIKAAFAWQKIRRTATQASLSTAALESGPLPRSRPPNAAGARLR